MAGVLFQKHHGSHPMDEASSDSRGYLARLAPVLCFSLQLDMLPNSTPLIQAHGKVHGRVRRQAHGGVHDMAYGRVQGRVRALLGRSRLIGLEDTQATATSLPQKTQHLALLHLCRTQIMENRKN